MTIGDFDALPHRANEPETASSQQGCEKLPSKKAEAADLQSAIDHATAEIDRLEGELRALGAQPGSPDRDRKMTQMRDAVAGLQRKRYQDSNKLPRLLDDIQDLESRCIKQA